MLCIAAGGDLLVLAATAFTLSWTHSVERTHWHESWRIIGGQLQVVEARVEGPGAGIAIPHGARMTPKGWVYRPELPPLPRLVLAASGLTPSAWTLCTEGKCHELGAAAGEPVTIWAAPTCAAEKAG
jgi:hypothetical protein